MTYLQFLLMLIPVLVPCILAALVAWLFEDRFVFFGGLLGAVFARIIVPAPEKMVSIEEQLGGTVDYFSIAEWHYLQVAFVGMCVGALLGMGLSYLNRNLPDAKK